MAHRPDEPFHIITNNRYCHEIKTSDGESISFVDLISMGKEQEKSLDQIRQRNVYLWNTDAYNGMKFFFISDDQQICAPKECIEAIVENETGFVDDEWLNQNLRIIDLNKKVYKSYGEMMTWKHKKSPKFTQISCTERMRRLKAIGNELYKVGACQKVAFQLYSGAASMFGKDDSETHPRCRVSSSHSKLLSNIFNNMSIICYERKDFLRAAKYCRKALKLNPHYDKCTRRLEEIYKKVNAAVGFDVSHFI